MCLPKCRETMAADCQRTKRLDLEGRRPVHFFGISTFASRSRPPLLPDTFCAHRIRNKANNGQTASYKAKCEHLAACYARLAEQFLTASILQAVELPKP